MSNDVALTAITLKSAHQPGHMTWVNVVYRGYLFLLHAVFQRNDFRNLRVSNFGQVVVIALRPIAATLVYHVSRVLFRGAQKQMAGVHALLIVAGMAHIKTPWDFSCVQNIRRPVGINGCAIEPERTVSSLECSASPFPAGVGFIDIGIKASQVITQRCFWGWHSCRLFINEKHIVS